jgi:hypothetical protein
MVFWRALLYSELVASKTDGKWRKDLITSVKQNKLTPEFESLLIEYGDYIENIPKTFPGVVPAATLEYARDHPDHTTKNGSLKHILELLVNSVDGKRSLFAEYGNNSPLGPIIDQLHILGVNPIKNQLTASFLR